MTTLIKADLGCNIGGIYYGTVFYADDIVLLYRCFSNKGLANVEYLLYLLS